MPKRLIDEGRLRLAKAGEADPATPHLADSTVDGSTAVLSPNAIPAPYAPTGEDELSAGERDDLATCEAAVDNLRVAFCAAGKALQVIRDAHLYRDTHDTFEDYVEERWDISRPQAYRLIAAWPLAELLSPIGDKKKLNESQVRELLPLADLYGQDAAVTVYSTVAEVDGVQVTAKLLRGVIDDLPDDHFDPAEATEQIRQYLADGPGGPPRPGTSPVDTFAAQSERLLRALHRVTAGRALRAALDADPAMVRKVIADVRAQLDAIESDVNGQPAADGG
jgi:hypothetical protein